jgi:hypothetical protein
LEDVLWLIHHSKFSCISNALGEKLGKSWGKIRNFFGQNGEKMVKTADLYKISLLSEKYLKKMRHFDENIWKCQNDAIYLRQNYTNNHFNN